MTKNGVKKVVDMKEKEIHLTNAEALEIENTQALNRLAQCRDPKLPIKKVYRLSRYLAKLQSLVQARETARHQLLERYARKDADGKFIIKDRQYDIPDEIKPEFHRELNDLDETKTGIGLAKITLTLETEVPAGLLSAADILALDAVVVDFVMPP